MRITSAKVDELMQNLTDLRDDSLEALIESAEIWLDEGTDKEDRADARDWIEEHVETLEEALLDILVILDPKWAKVRNQMTQATETS